MKSVVIIPTLNPDRKFEEALEALRAQNIDDLSVIIVDSDSDRREYLPAEDEQLKILTIDRKDFNHGATRNLGACHFTDANTALVFMTQDAVIATAEGLRNLIAPIERGEVAATFGRQLPRREATETERFSRYFNYPSASRVKSQEDIPELGVKAFFFSNVFSAVRADLFWEVGGFPETVIMNEDMTLAAKLLRRGYRVEYVADAEVIHSHDYTLKQQFKRNFDVGAFFSDAGPELAGAAVTGEGLKFVSGQVRYVLRHGRPELVPRIIAESAAKFSAFQLGKRQRRLPASLKKKLSMHSYHWDRKEKA